jgi:serine protease AprX
MAAPVVTGVVALMLERNPSLTPAQVKARLKGTASPLAFGSLNTTGTGLVNAVAAVTAGPSSDPLTEAVSAGFASEMYSFLYGQPLSWRDLTFNGGVDANGIPWSEVTWSNVSWDAITWANVDWASFNWSTVNWQEISWEEISWEGITWESRSLKDKSNGRRVRRGWEALD